MRRTTIALAVLSCALLAGCNADDVAPPVLERPIQTLPAGAHVVVLTQDLANTWARVESHDLPALLQSLPAAAPIVRSKGLERVMAACREFETATGTSLRDDVLLNALGARAGIGLYLAESEDAAGNEVQDGDLVVVAELRDPARFTAALERLSTNAQTSVQVARDVLDGDNVWRFSGADGVPFYLWQNEAALVASSNPARAREALALQSAGPPASGGALSDPTIVTAMAAVGAHNVTALVRRDAGGWQAQGFTWGKDGLRFDHAVQIAADAPPAATKSQREAILRSLPDGMTLAAYAQRAMLESTAHQGLDGHGDAGQRGMQAHLAHTGGHDALPFFDDWNAQTWAGDEVGIALRGVEATALAPIPDLAIVLTVRDQAGAAEAMRALESRLTSLPVGSMAAGFVDVTYGGRTFRTMAQPFAANVSPSWLLDGDIAVVATTRTLLEQIIDTRRTGRRHAESDASFKPFRDFVPDDAGIVVYADQKRLRRVTQELERSAKLYGPKIEQGVTTVARLSELLEHFPAGAAYAARSGDRLTVRGWMLEGH